MRSDVGLCREAARDIGAWGAAIRRTRPEHASMCLAFQNVDTHKELLSIASYTCNSVMKAHDTQMRYGVLLEISPEKKALSGHLSESLRKRF